MCQLRNALSSSCAIRRIPRQPFLHRKRCNGRSPRPAVAGTLVGDANDCQFLSSLYRRRSRAASDMMWTPRGNASSSMSKPGRCQLSERPTCRAS